jgi:type IV pilus assembly protein PilC
MPGFEYEAMNAQGKALVGEVEARNTDEAIAKIRQMSLFPTRVTERKAAKQKGGGGEAGRPGRVRKRAFAIGGVGGKALTAFTRQLSTLTDAGIPIVQSLNILENQMRACRLKNIIGNVADDVEAGSSLSEAMAIHPKAYDKLYCNMVKAGETGGMLDLVLQRLAEFREKAARLKRKVVSALVYPLAVVLIAGTILTLIMVFLVPEFTAMFKEMGLDLPMPTLLLIALSSGIVVYWYAPIIAGIAIVVAYKVIRSTNVGATAIDWIKFHVPLFGNIINKAAIARFTRTFGTLISSGVPILEALNISRDTSGNQVLANAIQHVHDSVREGDPIAPPLGQSHVCNDIVVNMISVGEETGNLDMMLIKIADQYDNEVDTAVDGLTSLIEPVMVIGLGLMIGGIVIALFLPMIAMIEQLSG